METRPTVCLVDGSGYIFRAFYALPPMTRPDGVPVNAVYGFMNMMMNLSQDNLCSHIVVIFDAKRRNFRNDIYPAYKENRREVPADLIPQFALIRQAAEALNIPWIEQEGYEADDLIATYARLAVERGWQARVVSADKDLMQLKRTGVAVYDPMKKKDMTDDDVIKKFGVPPAQMTDVQALMGDSTDNIPGGKGIGPKTAAELIIKYGTLENLLAHLDEIPQQKRREGLIRDADLIRISKRLVVLDDRVAVGKSLDEFAARAPDETRLKAFLSENGFTSLVARVQNWLVKRAQSVGRCQVMETQSETAAPVSQALRYDMIDTAEALKDRVAQIRTAVAVSVEVALDSIGHNELVGVALCPDNGRACYVPLRHGERVAATDLFSAGTQLYAGQMPVAEALAILKPLWVNPNITKVGHPVKAVMHTLSREYGGLEMAPIDDTQVMSAVLDGSTHRHDLPELARLYLSHEMIPDEQVGQSGKGQFPFREVPIAQAGRYAAEKADMIMRLYRLLKERLKTEEIGHIYAQEDCPLIPILFRMEERGILVDKGHLKQLEGEFAERVATLTNEIYTLAGHSFNINSPGQLGAVFFEEQGLTGGKKSALGTWITDVKVLENLAAAGSELAEKVLEYRSISKLKSTYADALLALAKRDRRIHTTFSLTATNTGRLASSDPNLQNIPIRTDAGKEIRRAFIAKPGCKLVCADYSQIELRLMAEVAGVAALIDAFRHGDDIHARTAAQIFDVPRDRVDADMRRRAKAINFGIMYGMSAFGLAENLKIGRSEAKQYIEAYFAKYPEIKTYMERTEQEARTNGFVMTPFGRKCFIRGLDNGRTRGFALRAAINAPIQGGAADIIKRAMRAVETELTASGLDGKMLLQVHDELVFEVAERDVPAVRDLVKRVMESVVAMRVPLIVEVGVGENWKEAH